MKRKGTETVLIRRISRLIISSAAVILSVLMLVYSLYLKIGLNRQNDINVELREKLADTVDENRHLRIEYEIKTDLSELEKYARERLGMRSPTRDQIRISDFIA